MYMSIFDDYEKAYNTNEPFLYVKSVFADCETPVSLYYKLTNNQPYSFLFESVQQGETRARYTVIGYQPDLLWHADLATSYLYHNNDLIETSDKPIQHLRNVISMSHVTIPDALPPIAAGIYGYMSYDAIRYVEHISDNNMSDINMHDALYMRPTIMVVHDNVTNIIHICCPIYNYDDDARVIWNNLQHKTLAEIAKLQQILPATIITDEAKLAYSPCMSNDNYKHMVETAKNYIKAGDIFQVVLSQRFHIDNFYAGDFAFYRALRTLNPSPYMFYMNLPDYVIIGASPETMCKLEGQTITIRPLAGTRKRGYNVKEDAALSKDLLSDAKERAEHLMLLDLGRNDVGKASQLNSVQVTESFNIEYYSHVMHIVSNVEGTLRNGLDAVDVLFAGMPAGTVSGAPKVRAMQIIEECEDIRRNFYAGCVGYFSANGDMDHAIALRTALYDKKETRLIFQAGAGIVYDSIAEDEHQECINKSQALLHAARQAHHFTIKHQN